MVSAAILTGVWSSLAAILLTTMLASFTLPAHVPWYWPFPLAYWIWSENAVNLALIVAAWVVADSLLWPRR